MQNADIARTFQLYEPLLYWDHDYKVQPAVAESVTPSADAKTWTVKLRKGVTFHNGKDVTPEDVLFTLHRVAGPQAPPRPASRWPGSSTSTAPRRSTPRQSSSSSRRRTPCCSTSWPSTPSASCPADYDPKNPVGTGPFKYKSFSPGKDSVFTRYDDYWGGKAYVDEVHIQDFADPSAQVNALQAGQIQTMDNLPYNLINSVKGQAARSSRPSPVRWVPFTMRVDVKPFTDVRVRQAMRLITDRQQMIDNALSGKGRLGNDLYAPFDPAYAKDLPQREQDIDQAKSLLKQAGQEGLQVQLFTGDDIGSVAPASAALFARAGQEGRRQRQGGQEEPLLRRRLPLLPVRPGLLEHPQLPAAGRGGRAEGRHLQRDALGQVARVPEVRRPGRTRPRRRSTRPSATRLLQDAQKIEYDEGGYIIWGFRTQVDAVSPKVQGLKPSKFQPLGNYDFKTVSLST